MVPAGINDVVIGLDHIVRTSDDLVNFAGNRAMNVLDCCNARRNHLEGGVKRIEIEIDRTADQPGDEPKLKRHVGQAELDRCEADMVMIVDQAP